MPSEMTNTMFIAIIGILAIAAVAAVLIMVFPQVGRSIGNSFQSIVGGVVAKMNSLTNSALNGAGTAELARELFMF